MTLSPKIPGDEPPLNVALVFRAPLGGLFRNVCDLARGLDARGHRVGLICNSAAAAAHAEAALDALRPSLKLGVERVRMHRAPHPTDLRALAATAGVLKRWNADVAHGHGSKGGLYARLAATPRPGVARAYTPHGGSFHYKPGSPAHHLFMLTERALKPHTDAFLFESAYMRDRVRDLIGPSGAVSRVCLNGLGADEFEPAAPKAGAADLFFIGEFRPVKGLDTLIDALALIRARNGRGLRAILVGGGPEEDDLRRRVAAAGLGDLVAVRPPMRVRDACREARVMVLPSRFESLPYVAIEVAACGTPLVATDVGGIAEIAGPLADQLIAPDDAVVLADALLAKLDQPPAEREADSERLRAHVRAHFCVNAMVDGVVEGYRAALERRRGAARGALAA